MSALPPVALGPWMCSGPRPLAGGEFSFLFRLFFGVFFEMVRRQLHSVARIRSSMPDPRSGGASSVGEGRVKSCARRISRDPIVLCVRRYGFMLVSSDLRLSSVAMVAALVR
jgi:hypothetical protein